MPHSHPFGKDWAANLYAVTKPDKVIDIGPGAGMWHDALSKRHPSWWVGVEIWEPYIQSYGLSQKYDELVIADAREYIYRDDLLAAGTLVIAGDVLEHIPQEDAEQMIAYLWEKPCHVLVSVPIVHYDQGPLEGNVHETHLWHPTHEWVMDTLRPDIFTLGDIVGAYWSAP